MTNLFKGFASQRLDCDGADIFLRTGGNGPPLALLHGYPQSHAMWHKIAPALARHFTVIMPDLRGYGLSSCPRNRVEEHTYSKRVMGADIFKIMTMLGHARFFVCGHDRGGRVAYRMALDEPDRIAGLAVLDIVPTFDQWRAFDMETAIAVYHWPFLAQPFPLPEMLIERDPVFYLDWTLASWTASRDLSAFDPDALREYRTYIAEPSHVHAMCNDYRAGATRDFQLDREDREAGRRITCPTLALWGEHGIPGDSTGSPLDIWRAWCDNVTGRTANSGHFVAEEAPEETTAHLIDFLAGE